jgi:PAS domain S-box-containing protein
MTVDHPDHSSGDTGPWWPAGLRDRSIKHKVIALALVTSATVVLLSGLAFIIFHFVTFRGNTVSNLSSTASLLGATSGSAVSSGNFQEAQEVLATLRANPNVAAAAFYDSQGDLLARYPARLSVGRFPLKPPEEDYRSENGFLQFTEPVYEGRARVGTLFLKSDVTSMDRQLRMFVPLAVVVMGASLGLAWLLAYRLQRRITLPILAVTDIARAVAERKNYSVRVPRLANDEVGLLSDSVNRMLEKLEEQTAMVRRNEELRSFLVAALASSDDAIIAKDLESRIVSWNAGAVKMYGFTEAEMLGQPVARILCRPWEEAQILEEAKKGNIRHYETERIRKDGHTISVALTISPIRGTSGEVIGVSSIARDITARKQAERELQESRARISAIINSAMDAVISVDSEQRITLFNKAAENMFRCPASDALGRPLPVFIPTGLEGIVKQELAPSRRGNGSHAQAGTRYSAIRSDGERFPIEASVSQVEVGTQKISTIILRDITHRMQAEEQIRLMTTELEQRVQQRTSELIEANRELESFTYTVAHDLRAPLRHMEAFSKILLEDFATSVPEEARVYLEAVRTGSRNMSHLVDDLLNLARIGRQALKRHMTPLDSISWQVVTELKAEAAEAGRTVEWRVEPLPEVECDPGLMTLVFRNLLSNALKYSRPRSPAIIEVGCTRVGDQQAVFIRDNGVGFSMKYVGKLFGVFQRLHRAEEFEGTGVGLATVERVIRKHGGRVWAEAILDKGATFYFTIPGLSATQTVKGEVAITA